MRLAVYETVANAAVHACMTEVSQGPCTRGRVTANAAANQVST